ncbi:hypothetical protein [Postechiella marina]
MKNLKQKKARYFLTFLILALFSCNFSKETFIIEEVNIASDKVTNSKPKFKITKSGMHYSYSTKSKGELRDVTIRFNNESLTDILKKLEYPYQETTLRQNPFLNINYYKKDTTNENAVNEIISQLKKTYNL